MTVYCIIHKAERGERIELRVAELNSLFNSFLSQNRESFINKIYSFNSFSYDQEVNELRWGGCV